ncbi:MAG: MATE family efflux transporter [Chitinivibrionales bacterium]|nr:MATE family efflux transporter [Chitinivibrionales bacterium]
MSANRKDIPGMFAGPVLPVAVKIGTPIFIGLILQFFYMVVDTIFITRIDPASTALISGTSLMFPIFFIFMSIGQSMSIGMGTNVGHAIGERNFDKVKIIVASGIMVALVIGIPTIIVGYGFSQWLVNAISGDKLTAEAIQSGLAYLYFLLPGLALMLVSQVFFGLLQGEGLTKYIARAMMLSTVFNIVLDPVFIFVLNMGVAGAAFATTISVSITLVYVVMVIARGATSAPISFNPFLSNLAIAVNIVRIGSPHMLSMASLSISIMFFNKLVSGIGQVEMTAWGLVGRMDHVVLMPSFAVAATVITMVSQNFGRKNYDRVRHIYIKCLMLAFSLVGGAALVYMLSAPALFALLSSVNEVVRLATYQVRLLSLTFLGVSAAIVSSAVFQATGKPLPAVIIVVVRMFVVAVPLSYLLILVFDMGMNGLFIALAVSNLGAIPGSAGWCLYHINKIRRREASSVSPE